MKVKIDIFGLERWHKIIKGLPKRIIKVALQAVGEYIIGDMSHGLKHYQRYKHITRKKAYRDISYTTKSGKKVVGYKSAAQHHYVMAAIRDGRIDPGAPHRTGNTQRGYVLKVSGGKIVISNKTQGALYTRHEIEQARLNALAGWKKTGEIIKNNIVGALHKARAAIRKELNK